MGLRENIPNVLQIFRHILGPPSDDMAPKDTPGRGGGKPYAARAQRSIRRCRRSIFEVANMRKDEACAI